MIPRRLRLLRATALATVLALSSCAPSTPAPDEAVAAQLEQTVLAVTTAVADEEWAAAAADLDALEVQVDTAVAAGGLNADRAADIRAVIELVRAEIDAALSEPGPEPEPSTKPTDDKPGNGNGNKKP